MKKHYLFIFFLLLLVVQGYSQNQLTPHGTATSTTPSLECGHDAIPKKYQYDYADFDKAAYAKFMEVEYKSARTDQQQATSRSTPITVTFKNVGKVAVDKYWVSNGKLIKYRSIPAGQTIEQNTYIGHEWVFKDRDLIVGTYTVNRENTSYIVSPMDDSCFEIPVNLVVVYKSDGTGNQSKAELYEKFDQMNKLCENSNWRVRFKITRFEQVYSDYYYSIPRAEIGRMVEIRDKYTNYPAAVPLIQNGYLGKDVGGLGGVHLFAFSINIGADAWLHEIGHFFGLHHTHAQLEEGKELVNGSNCRVAGDLLCDTPASPNTVSLIDNCTYIGTERDPNGMLYRPDIKNVMGYNIDCEKNVVTFEQEKRLLFFLRNFLVYKTIDPCSTTPLRSKCTEIFVKGRARDIGSGGGQTYMVGATDRRIYQRKADKWEGLPFEFDGERLDVTGAGTPWVVAKDNRIYYYANNRWVNTNGRGLDVGCSGNEVYVIGTDSMAYRRVNNGWQKLPDLKAKRIDVDGNGRPWIASSTNSIYKFINDTWQRIGLANVKDVSIAEGGQKIWILSKSGIMREYIGKNMFTDNGYESENITVGSDNVVWTTDEFNNIYKKTCEELQESQAPLHIYPGTYSITSKQSNKALSLYGWNKNNGNNIIQWDYLGFDNQQWMLEHLGDNVYTVTLKYSNKGLDVTGVRTNNGANIHQWDYVGGENQKWKIQPVGDGYYRLIAVHSGKALSINRNLTTNGANIHQWEYVDVSSQKWRFDQVAAGRSKQEGHSMEVFASKGRNAEVQFVANQAFKPTQYHIQHSTDKVNFATISSLPASDVSDLDTYQFTDESPHDGQNYYQVAVEYEDGYQEIIPAQSLDFPVLEGGISVFPNPAQDELFINLKSFIGQGGQLSIVNPYGQLMQQLDLAEIQDATVRINTTTYENGLYYLNVQVGKQKMVTEKILIHRLY